MDTIKQMLDTAKTIAIFGHEYVDGDCIGAMLGLGSTLASMDKNITYFTPYEVGKSLQFVPGRETIQTTFDYGKYDILIFVDFCTYDRISTFTKDQETYFDTNKIIIIDHHEGESPQGSYTIKDTQASSTCELLYEHIHKRRSQHISKDIATYLYIGLTTDTGNFMYEKDSIRLLYNALGLIQHGADKKRVIDNIMYRNSMPIIQFSNLVIQRTEQQGDILRTYYDDTEIQKYDIDKDQADFGFHTLRTIYGPKIYIRIRKSQNTLKGSVRGNGQINCAQLCETLFHGGGHHNAAGFSIIREAEIQQGVKHIIEKIQHYIKDNA